MQPFVWLKEIAEPLLIVDDSKMMRNAIRGIFAADDRIQVAGEAADGEAALEIIPQIDPDVKPGNDFFDYVNGKWLATFEIPADKSRYGVFDALRDTSEENVHAIVTEVASSSPAVPRRVGFSESMPRCAPVAPA